MCQGYGCATLFWLLKTDPETFQKYDRCGTIMDFIVTLLTENPKVKTSGQIAASWGYFDTVKKAWNQEILSSAGFPTEILPEVQTEMKAGVLAHSWFDIPKDTPISVAQGDFLVTLESPLGYQKSWLNITKKWPKVPNTKK